VASAYTLSVIPLFVLLGEVASNTRLSADLFNAARLPSFRCPRRPGDCHHRRLRLLRCRVRFVDRYCRDH